MLLSYFLALFVFIIEHLDLRFLDKTSNLLMEIFL